MNGTIATLLHAHKVMVQFVRTHFAPEPQIHSKYYPTLALLGYILCEASDLDLRPLVPKWQPCLQYNNLILLYLQSIDRPTHEMSRSSAMAKS